MQQEEPHLLLQQSHKDILVIAKKTINRRIINLFIILLAILISIFCDYISKADVVIFYICYIVALALYDPFEKLIFIAEDICIRKKLHNIKSVIINAKKAVHIKNFMIILFIQLAVCSDNKTESKYPIIIFFIIYVIINFIYNPMKKMLVMIEDAEM